MLLVHMTCNSTVLRHPGKSLLTNLSNNLHGSKINIAFFFLYEISCESKGYKIAWLILIAPLIINTWIIMYRS